MATKLCVSVPRDLANAVRERTGKAGLSSFVARAMLHELEREQLGDFLAMLAAKLGPVPKKKLSRARRALSKH